MPDLKIISLQYVAKDTDDLHFLLVHEICHAWSIGHSGKWRERMLKAANKAHCLGRVRLSKMLHEDVERYKSKLGQGMKAGHIYNMIEDAVYDLPNTSYDNAIKLVAQRSGCYPEEIEKYNKKCKRVYEKAVKERRALPQNPKRP